MGNLDAHTLIIIEAFILFLMGGLLLLAALQGRYDRTLMWASASPLLGGLGFALGIVRTYGTHGQWINVSIVLSNMPLIMAHGCLWISLRAFMGRSVHRAWLWLLPGVIVWFGLCQWSWFMSHVNARIFGFCLISLVYYVLAMREIWPERRNASSSVVLVLSVLTGHGLYYVYRLLQAAQGLEENGPWITGLDFKLTVFESILFVVSVSFGILIMVRERTERQYRHASLHDALTSLPNRRALFEQGNKLVKQARRDGQNLAVLMCDLDHFKHINDRYGHEAGDQILIMFAGILRGTVDANAVCARIGGEEFVIIAPGLRAQEASQLAINIRENLSKKCSEMTARVSASIGISCAATGGYDLDRLLIRADNALYEAKASGRDCARLWSAETEVEPLPAPVARSGR